MLKNRQQQKQKEILSAKNLLKTKKYLRKKSTILLFVPENYSYVEFLFTKKKISMDDWAKLLGLIMW